jgi:sugar/nucleoside kinase (ribokinase family)
LIPLVRFAAVGDVMVDVVCSRLPPLETRVHAEVSIRAGGSAVNAAAAAVSAGASASVVGRIGTGPAADLVAAEVEELGIEAHLARDPDLPTGIAVSLGADPSSPSVVANRGANARLSPEDIPDPSKRTPSSSPASRCFRRGRPRQPGRHWIASGAPGRAST